MKRFTKMLCMLLALVMVVGMLPLSILADGAQTAHTVKFNLNYNGAHQIPAQTVEHGQCATQPENVTREGWIFQYWYVKTGDGIQKFDLTQSVTEDMTLYARWDEDINYWGPIWGRNLQAVADAGKAHGNTYTVTFDPNGTDVTGMPAAQRVKEGGYATEPAEPSRAGYTFLGWCDSYGNHFNFDTPIENDITLYANFVKNIYNEDEIRDILSGYTGELTETLDSAFSPITGVDIYYRMDDVGSVYIRKNIPYCLNGVAGIIGNPIDIGYTGGVIKEAQITLYFSNVSRKPLDLSDLAVFRYNAETDTITILDDIIRDTDDSSIRFTTTQFGVIGVIQKSIWDAVQKQLLPAIRTDDTPYYNVVMAMDVSGSMSGEKLTVSKQVSCKFIDVLANDDYFSLISFADSAAVLFSRDKLVAEDGTDNRDTIKTLINGLYASGGTNIDSSLRAAANECIDNTQYKNLIVLVSDGQSDVSEETFALVKSKSAVVIAVGIGSDVDNAMMQEIANMTGGSYIYCKDASDLQDAFLALQAGYIGSTKDSDNDGLPDIVEITGMRDQYGEIWKTDPNVADSDNDGYSDGEEMGVYHDSAHPYFERVSRPDMFTKKEQLSVVLTLNGNEDPYIQNSHTYIEWEDTNKEDNRFTIVSNLDIALYRMVPDIITPIEPDGIPKEYIYEAPASITATLADLKFTGLGQVAGIQYKTTISQYGIYSISYTTRAEVTLKKNTTSRDITNTLISAKWKYDIDGCILYKTNVWDTENRPKIVNKAAIIPEGARSEDILYTMKYKIGGDSMTIDEAKKLVAVKILARTLDTSQDTKLKNIRIQDIKNQITVTGGTVPDEVIVAFAETIIESVKGGGLDELEPLKAPYDITSIDNSFVKQITKAIAGGIIEINKNVSANGKNYSLSGFSYSFAGQGAAGCTVNSKTTLTWKLSEKESQNALAIFCNTLAQLNTDAWKEFTSSYVTSFFSTLSNTAKKSKVDAVFDKCEPFLKALTTADDKELKNLLTKEFYEKISGRFVNPQKRLKEFIKNLIPDGKFLLDYANQYKYILEDISNLENAATEIEKIEYTQKLLDKLNSLAEQLKDISL